MEDALGVAGDCLDALSKEGWANNRTALLTTKDRQPIHPDYYEHEATKEYWQEFHAKEVEFYTRMLGFKGLENFFRHLKDELFHRVRFLTAEPLTAALNEYIRWYNTERISTKLKGLSPVQYGAQALAA